jgi:hypothetical protein
MPEVLKAVSLNPLQFFIGGRKQGFMIAISILCQFYTKKKDESLHPFLTNQTYFYEKKLNFYRLLLDTNVTQALVNASKSTLKNFKSSHTTSDPT